MAGKISGIVLPDNFGASLGGTPEEAAKRFLGEVTQGMGQVLANAIQQAIGEAVGNVGAPPDWTRLVRGCVCNVYWDTPEGTDMQSLNAFASAGEVGALGGIGFEIGIRGTF